MATEYWLRGPVEGVPLLLQPVAHALLQARDEVKESLDNFPEEALWKKPAGTASVGFHLQHLTGVLDRLFTYAKAESLSAAQLEFLQMEGKEAAALNTTLLYQQFHQQVEKALEQIRQTNETSLLEFRGVGRKQIPSNVLGLLFHAAEHTQRHTGQLLVTVKLLKGGLM